MLKRLLCFFALQFTLAIAAHAQDATTLAGSAETAAGDPNDPWSGTVSAGYQSNTGNTENESVNFKTEIKYQPGRWHHFLSAFASGRSEDKQTTAEAYSANWKSQYDLTDRYYAFGSVDWYKDRFSAYDQQLFETAGLGWRALTGPRHLLDVEIGAGARQSDLQDGTSEDEAVGVLRGIWQWQISENASFVQKAGVVSGSDNTFVESVSELKAGIIGALSLVLGYTVRHNSDVPPDTDKTDTYTSLSLEYAF